MLLFDFLRASPAGFVVFSSVIGLLVGSFLNVVIHRLPKMMERDWKAQIDDYLQQDVERPASTTAVPTGKYNLTVPRSACPSCGHQITAIENIPIISYLAIGGKCRGCKAPISARYPLVEALTGIISGLLAWRFGFGLPAVAAIIFAWAMISLTFIDFDTQLLPDDITLPLLWLGLLLNIFHTFTDLPSAVVGAILGYLALWSVYWAFKLITGKEGMGYGDFKLLAAIGAWLGWAMLPLVILLSAGVGAVVGISLMLFTKHGRDTPIPFGPYLAAAGLIALVWGKQITQAYLHGM
jgi:leader peptidase (prepilin peptidase) / N-methyltransferase